MVGIKVSKGHYLVTSAEVLDSLNPIITFLEFQRATQPADPSANDRGRIFFETASNRLKFLRRNDGDTAFEVIDLEGGGGEVAVWTQDHDSDGFNLIIDTDGDSALIMDRDALVGNDQLGIALGGLGVLDYLFTETAFNMIGNQLTNVGDILFDQSNAQFADSATAPELNLVLSAGDIFRVTIGAVDEFDLTATAFNLRGNQLLLDVAGTQIIEPTGTGIDYTVPSADTHDFWVNATLTMRVDEGFVNFDQSYLDLVEATAPVGTPALTEGWIYFDTADNTLKIKKNSKELIFPVDTDINKYRYVIEAFNSWLKSNNRIILRYDRYATNFESYIMRAFCMVINTKVYNKSGKIIDMV